MVSLVMNGKPIGSLVYPVGAANHARQSDHRDGGTKRNDQGPVHLRSFGTNHGLRGTSPALIGARPDWAFTAFDGDLLKYLSSPSVPRPKRLESVPGDDCTSTVWKRP